MLVSRQREQEILRNSLKEEQSSFIAIYGRRRVGKTFLVRETFGDAIFFSHTGIADGTLKLQLKAFYDSAVTAGCDAPKVPKDWIEAFSILKQSVMKSRRRKKVIFLDELSWMDTPRSHFLTALEFFWNGWASGRKDIVLIVCASATSWIMDNIVHNKGGLHNRLNDQIQLNPFTLKECEELARANGLKTDRQDILQYYMALGGIPYYWKLLERGASTAQNFDRLFFTENARLRDEYEYLYASLFKKPEPYVAIVSTLAKKKSGMTRLELITAAHLTNSGVTTKKLRELEQCGFIRRCREYGKQRKDAVYQLIDSFTLFYFSFMANKSSDPHFWMHSAGTPKINTWKGLAFERVCLLHSEQIRRKLGIAGVLTETYSWRCKADEETGISGSQIDLLICRKDRVINICEIKYSDGPYSMTKAVYNDVLNKINDFRLSTGTKYALFPTLITSSEVKKNAYSEKMQACIDGDDLFL